VEGPTQLLAENWLGWRWSGRRVRLTSQVADAAFATAPQPGEPSAADLWAQPPPDAGGAGGVASSSSRGGGPPLAAVLAPVLSAVGLLGAAVAGLLLLRRRQRAARAAAAAGPDLEKAATSEVGQALIVTPDHSYGHQVAVAEAFL
jgi:hypothetical protein